MSDIDAEKLQEALAHASASENFMTAGQKLILAAARAHLATLPRWKTVGVVQWAAITERGEVIGTFWEEEAAVKVAAQRAGDGVVKLTGTARVRV